MKYTSTREDKELLNFKQVTLKGLASDGGLYVPKNWKQPNLKFSNTYINFEKTAYEIIKYFVGKSLEIATNNTLVLDKPINLEANDALRVYADPLSDSSTPNAQAFLSVLEVS